MKKIVQLILLLFSLVNIAFFGTYFVINSIEIPRKIVEVQYFSSDSSTLSETKSENLEKINPTSILLGTKADRNQYWSQIYKFFSRISIDLSAITPFLFLWFSLTLGWYTCKVGIRGASVDRKDYAHMTALPLPKTYASTWIQLGFVGTIWGFMLIGLRMQGASAAESAETLDILLKAFGTALLSTFAAVVLTYIIAPVVKSLWQWSAEFEDGIDEDEDIEKALQVLIQYLKDTSTASGQFEKSVKQATRRFQPFDNAVDQATQMLSAFHTQTKESTTVSKQLESSFKTTVSSADHVTSQFNTLNDTTSALSARLSKDATQATEDFSTGLSQTSDSVGQFGVNLTQTATSIGQFITVLNQTAAAIGKLNRELGTLQQRVEAFPSQEIVTSLQHLTEMIQAQHKETLERLYDIRTGRPPSDRAGMFSIRSLLGMKPKPSQAVPDSHPALSDDNGFRDHN